jgi:hypothetical protein
MADPERPPVPTPEPEPPSPEPRPEPVPASPLARPELEREAERPGEAFQAMLAQLQRPSVGPRPDLAPTPEGPAPPGPAGREAPPPGRPAAKAPPEVAPTEPPPKRWAGQFDTPEALEARYKETEARMHRAEQAAERLERLLSASLEGAQPRPTAPGTPAPAHPVVPGPDPYVAIREEAARLALEDPQANPQRFIRAVALAVAADQQARQAVVQPALTAMQQEAEQRRQVQQLQDAFFTKYPEFRQVKPALLREIALEAEQRLYREDPRGYGTETYLDRWFSETARDARSALRLGPTEEDGGQPPPAASSPSARGPAKASAKPKGAPFAETPAPRPAERPLTGQAVHLARIFGSQP